MVKRGERGERKRDRERERERRGRERKDDFASAPGPGGKPVKTRIYFHITSLYITPSPAARSYI